VPFDHDVPRDGATLTDARADPGFSPSGLGEPAPGEAGPRRAPGAGGLQVGDSQQAPPPGPVGSSGNLAASSSPAPQAMRADQPSGSVTAARPPWTQWTGTGGLPHRPRGLPPPAPATSSASECLADLSLTVATERVYDAVDDLARALLAQRDAYTPWQRRDPAFKPVVSGFLWTPSGPRRVTVMLDTGATHCFVCAQLADLLNLPQGSAPGPRAVSMASPDTTRSLSPPVRVHLALGEAAPLREVLDMSPLDLGPGLDIILGWDWISSHDLRFLFPLGAVTGVGPAGPLEAPLLSTTAPGPAQVNILIGHGEFCRMLRRMVPAAFAPDPVPRDAPGPSPPPMPPARHGGGMSKPLEPLGTAEIRAPGCCRGGPPSAVGSTSLWLGIAGSPLRGRYGAPLGWYGTSSGIAAVRRHFADPSGRGSSCVRCSERRVC